VDSRPLGLCRSLGGVAEALQIGDERRYFFVGLWIAFREEVGHVVPRFHLVGVADPARQVFRRILYDAGTHSPTQAEIREAGTDPVLRDTLNGVAARTTFLREELPTFRDKRISLSRLGAWSVLERRHPVVERVFRLGDDSKTALSFLNTVCLRYLGWGRRQAERRGSAA
jgi:hypothetical protein